MARPKRGAVKQHLNLTVSEEVKDKLNELADYYGKSISALLEIACNDLYEKTKGSK